MPGVFALIVFFSFVLILIKMCLDHNMRVEKMKLEYKYGKREPEIIDYTDKIYDQNK